MIVNLDILAGWRKDSTRNWVLCHGCFDMQHIGHLRHLRAARLMGDLLVVTITPDHFVNKGSGRPLFPELMRAEVVAALKCVDWVAVNRWPTAVEAIRLLRPAVFVKGGQYRNEIAGPITAERYAVDSVGGRLEFTDEVVHSSTAVIDGEKFARSGDAYLEVMS